MKNQWNQKNLDRYIKKYKKYGLPMAERTYSAQLLGQESQLVLHGGGNTSVKSQAKLITGQVVPILCVKGSGWDLATIEPQGHPALQLEPLRELRKLKNLSDEDMVNFQRTHMLDASGPNPSIETLLHAFLPQKFVDHTHADAILALVDQPYPKPFIKKWCEGKLAIVPYVKPGFTMAKMAADAFEKNPKVEGIVLLNHGLITFGATAKESYQRTIKWVTKAEQTLTQSKPFKFKTKISPKIIDISQVSKISQLIRSNCGGFEKNFIVRHRSNKQILDFVNSPQACQASLNGPPTPDHVIRTKIKPLIAPEFSPKQTAIFSAQLTKQFHKYIAAYQSYVKKNTKQKRIKVTPLDPLPRIILVPGAGVFSIGTSAKAADVILDLFEHTMQTITNAMRIGRYKVLNDSDLFDIEYWSLEQAKLKKGQSLPMEGKVVWISGAAHGIGLATAQEFAKLGAHLFLTDIDAKTLKQAILSLNIDSRAHSFVCDITKRNQVQKCFDQMGATFGGVDIVISNAGTAPMGKIQHVTDETLRKSFEINFFSHQSVAQVASDFFQRQGLGGCLLFNASKGAFNPGPEFGPYNIPKTAIIALMRQCAIELGDIGVRSNAINADRIRTSIYKNGLLEQRAKARGLSVSKYLSGNLLKEEVLTKDVALGFVHLALSEKTTGAVLPIDGGNPAAFPR